jgi:hypothetical protein
MKIVISEIQYKKILESNRGGHNKLNRDEFIKKAQEIHKNPDGIPKYDYSLVDYVNSGTKVKVICPKHEKVQPYFEITPSKHLQGNGCKLCYLESKIKYSEDELKSAAEKVKSSIEFKTKFPSEYFASRKKEKKIPNFYKKITAHFDSLKKESYGEQEVGKILDDLSIRYEKEYEFTDCTNTKEGRFCRKLPFDFYLPELNTCIEYDGEQHFKESNLYGPEKFLATKKNDVLKNDFCKKNNIKLIRLHYKLKDLEENLKNALSSPENFVLKGQY